MIVEQSINSLEKRITFFQEEYQQKIYEQSQE